VRVLVAGAAGRIGRVLTVGLAERGHQVVGVDLVQRPHGNQHPWHVADCADPNAMHDVFDSERPDGVVHLAGRPGEASLPDSLTSHALTTAALLEAAVTHDVPRLVYASSNHAVGFAPRMDHLPVETRHRPDTFYGVGKVTGEALLSLYADRHGLAAIACRIGSFRPKPSTTRDLSTWLSPGDCIRMFDACLTASTAGFSVLYGTSANSRAWWDLEPGRTLGYQPLDDAEEFADQVRARAEDDIESAHVGGPFTTDAYDRPAWVSKRD